ncbi:PucR family transcriptional regulator [Egbenema bharatensis]|uniref:PucR family transcriptional regulator n=1 Tax=Egbenema bharatensis TaxID=3463334 RepID=UPI003A8C0C63
MLEITTGFLEVAAAVTAKVTELLYAPVFVVDQRGVVLTSSDPAFAGRLLHWEYGEKRLEKFLRVPLCHAAETAEILVGESYNCEVIPSRLAHALVELVVNQTVTQIQFPSQHKIKNRLLYDLLHGRITDESIALEQAAQLSMDLSQPRAVILIDAADYVLEKENNMAGIPFPEGKPDNQIKLNQQKAAIEQRRTKVVIGSIVSFFQLPSDTICVDLGQGNIGVLKASNSRNLDPWATCEESQGVSASWANLTALKRAANALLVRLQNDTNASINIGIGRYHPGLKGLARSYEDAHIALSLGTRLQGVNRIHCLGDMGIAAFVGIADEATKIDLAKYLLSPLNHETELLMTLNTFFSEDCCPSSTAKRLSIHRNTLSYRLDKIASLTGLEPRKFDDAVQMRLSLLLRSLQA